MIVGSFFNNPSPSFSDLFVSPGVTTVFVYYANDKIAKSTSEKHDRSMIDCLTRNESMLYQKQMCNLMRARALNSYICI